MNEQRQVTALLVDDEPHVRLFIKTALNAMGCKVVAEAANGAEAIELYRKHRPDVTLLDINMPVMDGRQALTAIRTEFPDAFVIMLTSLSSAEAVDACLDAGAANYLRKDTPLTELRQEIRQSWLDHLMERKAAGGTS